MGRKCEVYFCPHSETKNEGRSFYRFPRGKDRWVVSCNSIELEKTYVEGGPEAINKLKLKLKVEEHLENKYFLNCELPSKGLRNDAVPPALKLDPPDNWNSTSNNDGRDTGLNPIDNKDDIEYQNAEYLEKSYSTDEHYEDIEYLQGPSENAAYEMSMPSEWPDFSNKIMCPKAACLGSILMPAGLGSILLPLPVSARDCYVVGSVGWIASGTSSVAVLAMLRLMLASTLPDRKSG
ncbi:uncharacterized protein LOC134222529 [Armigeres subalbatus]|uniref:uncharacterized protein LOC134222529 n=1 Tax=Armigeres subalbatus TaxID=124917 RepID=UPI002ED0BE47